MIARRGMPAQQAKTKEESRMAVAAGQKAPGFDLPTDGGGRLRLEDFAGRPVVLYFFPKANILILDSAQKQKLVAVA